METVRLRNRVIGWLLMTMAACSRAPETNTTAVQTPVDRWAITSEVDPMTDVRTFGINIEGRDRGTYFGINCTRSEEAAFFNTPFLLGPSNAGQILLRLDDQEAEEWQVFLSQRTALLNAPRTFANPRDNVDLLMMQMSAHGFLATLKMSDHRRLRARLRSASGDQIDLEFDISGLRAGLHRLEERCHP